MTSTLVGWTWLILNHHNCGHIPILLGWGKWYHILSPEWTSGGVFASQCGFGQGELGARAQLRGEPIRVDQGKMWRSDRQNNIYKSIDYRVSYRAIGCWWWVIYLFRSVVQFKPCMLKPGFWNVFFSSDSVGLPPSSLSFTEMRLRWPSPVSPHDLIFCS